MNYTGNIYRISPMESREYNGKNFYSRKFAIEQKRFDEYTEEEKKSNFIEFEMKGQQNCASLDDWQIGTKVSVTFFIEGAKYNKKDKNGNPTSEEAIFNKVIATKIELWNPNGTSAPSTPSMPSAPAAPSAPAPASTDDDEDLPFD